MRKVAILAAFALAATTTLVAIPATAAAPNTKDSVARKLRGKLAVPADIRVDVHVLRGDDTKGVFGSAVLPSSGKEYPRGWLFLHKDGQTAFEGEPAFVAMARNAAVLNPEEKNVFTTAAIASTDWRTALRLPYAVGQSWSYTGGPHPLSGTIRSSIDLAGGDGRVLAAGGGLAYTMCGSGKGWLRVIHNRGLSTDYYHLSGNIAANGTPVQEGSFLGNIGTDVSCGGWASGKHVHFSLLRDGAYVAIDRYSFGKWSIRANANNYDGYAMHGSTRVNVNGRLYNYGALGLNQGIVDTDGGTLLNRRSGPGSSYRVIGTVRDGDTVTIVCSKAGTTHTGRGGYSTTLWNKLSDNSWVSDAYIWTGTGHPVAGYC
ncbi:MAG: peptidoglycan DD-metalloendopeptidase family protein [Longispora sp.]|nr:peptidoglycan DD-metalloendopeptidase family protein [Longispora sp. (in: high G+C Gram-positive bacteria)]